MWGLRFSIYDLWLRLQGARFRVEGLEFEV